MLRRTFITTSTAIAIASSGALAAGGSKDIVEIASDSGDFNTLLAAATAAGLVDTLKGDGPMTVFAPTDAAFAKLPEGTVDELLQPENKGALWNLVAHHVAINEEYASADLDYDTTARTAHGSSLVFSNEDGKTMVGDATIVKADIQASNGVIHVIDTVLDIE